MDSSQNITVVLGASANPERYSNMAVRLLKQYGHRVVPVNPAQDEIEGLKVVSSLTEVEEEVDTISVYLAPERLERLVPQVVSLHPRRVILNPGAESDQLVEGFEKAGIECVIGCTLVMLRTGQY